MDWKAFWGAFAGKIIAALFIAVCIALGFGPDKWVKFMIEDFPEWITPKTAQIAFVLLGLFTAGFLVIPPIIRKWKEKETRDSESRELDQAESHPEYVPLEDVARRAYEKHRTVNGYYIDEADFHEGFYDNTPPYEVLNDIALRLALEVDIYGEHPPSQAIEKINKYDLSNGTSLFTDGGKSIVPIGASEPEYINVCIKASEQDNAIELVNDNPPSVRELESGENSWGLAFAKSAFSNTATKENALIYLAHLRGKGVVIRNSADQLLNSSDLDRWAAKVNGWMERVIDVLRAVNGADAEWFRTLDAVPPARVPIPNLRISGSDDRDRFIPLFCQHDYRLLRLDRLLSKYGVGVTP